MSRVDTKRRMRTEALEARRLAARESGAAGELLAKNFLAGFRDYLAAAPPQVISGYWPMRDEIDVSPLMDRLSGMGVDCALPAVTGKGLPLVFRRWRSGDELKSGPFGTSEPPLDAPAIVPTLVLAPLLAFDRSGGRLGYGGGFYDRSLAVLRQGGPVKAVGVAFDAQEIDQAPMTASDQRLDWVVTQIRVIQCAG